MDRRGAACPHAQIAVLQGDGGRRVVRDLEHLVVLVTVDGMLSARIRHHLHLKVEHPALNLNEIAVICYVRTGRKPHLATVRSVLDEEPLPIKAFLRSLPSAISW